VFIELTEFLQCPAGHDPAPHCILLPDEMVDRRVLRGTIACPACRREYPITDGVVRFGEGAAQPSGAALPPADQVQALLGLGGPGGYVVVVGEAGRLAEPLSALMEGVHFVAVNAPAGVVPGETLTSVSASSGVPLRSSMARGVVVGRDAAREPWLGEGVRVLLPGRRIVACAEGTPPPSVAPLGSGLGMWVGEKPP
jgi:uncharacterized protein YbaR (Trm112 family)